MPVITLVWSHMTCYCTAAFMLHQRDDDDGDIVIEEVRSRPISVPLNTADIENKPEINVKTFASVPDNVTNIQSSSRGSTPAASATNDHHYAAMNNLMIHEPSWSEEASGSNPPPCQHRDHGYVRHGSNFQMEGIRPLEEVRPQTNDEHTSCYDLIISHWQY